MTLDDYTYHPPTDVTRPRYAAIRAVAAEAQGTIEQALRGFFGFGTPDAYGAISDACRRLHRVIATMAPVSADRAAAERCCRLARMAANEAVTTTNPADLARRLTRCLDEIDAARWQACAAIALAPEESLPPMPNPPPPRAGDDL